MKRKRGTRPFVVGAVALLLASIGCSDETTAELGERDPKLAAVTDKAQAYFNLAVQRVRDFPRLS